MLLLPLSGLWSRVLTPEERVTRLIDGMSKLAEIRNEEDDNATLMGAQQRYLLASVDKFVDEAQGILTIRAATYHVFGATSFVASLAVLHLAGLLAWDALHDIPIAFLVGGANVTHYLIFRIFSSLAVAAAVYAVVKGLISYGASFFHEATRLLDRRHALRFGRLYMYLKQEKFSFEEMEGAFQWHRESQTVFQGISPAQITDSSLNQALRTITQTAEAITKVKTAGGVQGKAD